MQTRRIRASLALLGARAGSLSSFAVLFALTNACSSAGPTANQPRDTSESVDSDTAPAKPVVGYLPNYRGPLSDWTNTLDFSALTHVTLAFASVDVDTEGSCGISIHYREKGKSEDDPGLEDFVKKAHEKKAHDKSTKVCLAVAGGGKLSDDFANVMLRWPIKLADTLAKYAHDHDLDCIDVDQEEPCTAPPIDEAYKAFIGELSQKLHEDKKQLSAAVGQWNSDKILPVISEFDFLSVMTYDYYQPWNSTVPKQASTIEDSQKELEWWVSKGADRAKLLWGVPFYGFKWNGDGTVGQAIPYRGIIEQLGSVPTQDELEFKGSTFTLNTTATIATKAKLAKEYYGGVMMWELWQDATDLNQSQLQVIKSVMQ